MIKYSLLDYNTSKKITERYNNFNFYSNKFIMNGFNIESFSYFLCDYNNFKNPLKESPDINAFNMRGITYIFNKDGSLYKTFYALPKFFNINQVENTQYDIIKNKKIKICTEKADGSCIMFYQLPDGSIHPKTLMGFDNDQVKAARKIYDQSTSTEEFRDMNFELIYKDLSCLIKFCLSKDYTPIFEYISYSNRIVLEYKTENLLFIGARNNITGEFYTCYDNIFDEFYVDRVEHFNYTLDDIIKLAETTIDKEGWVIITEDNQFIKIKTKWYFDNHFIRTTSIFREDYIIQYYINNELDDIISNIDFNSSFKLQDKTNNDILLFINNITDAVNNYIDYVNNTVKTLKYLYDYKYNKNMKEFAINEHNNKYFNLTKTLISKGEDFYKNQLNKHILTINYRLFEAQSFVKKWQNKNK